MTESEEISLRILQRLSSEGYGAGGRLVMRMTGTVLGPMCHAFTQKRGLPDWPEVDVRWDNGLKYGYRREHLSILP